YQASPSTGPSGFASAAPRVLPNTPEHFDLIQSLALPRASSEVSEPDDNAEASVGGDAAAPNAGPVKSDDPDHDVPFIGHAVSGVSSLGEPEGTAEGGPAADVAGYAEGLPPPGAANVDTPGQNRRTTVFTLEQSFIAQAERDHGWEPPQ
ncbi:hypothetical protein TeGR_g3847, partial [Tetraparma gracilis]